MSRSPDPPNYRLRCEGCGDLTDDDGFQLTCRTCGDNALLTVQYQTECLSVDPGGNGLFRYRDWLPVRRETPGSALPLFYRSTGLAHAIGAKELWIAFGGHWPERDCALPSGTFKDLEPPVVLGRLPRTGRGLLVASAGNTAAAFAASCGVARQPCLLIVPDTGLPALALVDYDPTIVKVVVVDGSYNHAISLAKRLSALMPELIVEGGVRNVARRAALGVVMMVAYETLGRLPDVYVQAVGSAAGALGCHDVATRIADHGRVPRVLLCQNREDSAISRLWRPSAWESTVVSTPVFAPELVNSQPPYQVAGGIAAMIKASDGDVLCADAPAAAAAAAMFEQCEGIDIEPAAAVATACLMEAVRGGRVAPDALVVLNVTGGGRRGIAVRDQPRGDLRVPPDPAAETLHTIARLAESLPS
jgi:cysteate synthase